MIGLVYAIGFITATWRFGSDSRCRLAGWISFSIPPGNFWHPEASDLTEAGK